MRKTVSITISLLITFIFLYVMITQIQWAEFYNLLDQVKIGYIILGVLVYFLSYYLRALRLKLLLSGKQATIIKLLMITLLHNFYNRIIPARLGDLSLIYFLKRYVNNGIASSTGIFIMLRIYDLLVSVLFLALSYSLLTGIGGITILLWIIVFAIMLVLRKPDLLVKLLKQTIKIVHHRKIYDWLEKKARQMEVGIKLFSSIKMQSLVLASTVVIWGLIILLFAILLNSLTTNYDFLDVMFATTLANFSWVLPINGIGGFGTMEASWGYAFSLRGYSFSELMLYAFYINVIVFLATIAFAIIPYLLLLKVGGNSPNETHHSDTMS